ncbi:hypothetical protein [Undibacterium curvum]|uniref:hypothetical protein n=1 Tax=Undibacterium curvum TaxID=2762294 RepID=UPI003D1231CD
MDATFQFHLGIACGTLLYSRFLSSAASFDWERAVVVGITCFVITVVLSKLKT